MHKTDADQAPDHKAIDSGTAPTAAPTVASTEAQPKPAKNPNEETVALDEPIIRGEQKIDSITLRKPTAGELRGVSLTELIQMEVGALRKVLPRITTPALLDHETGRMDPADLLQCGVAIAGFLLQRSAKTEAFRDE
ncbi:MAG: phage tail assembly protein [Pseudomonadaceae bacterium]